MKRWAVVGFDTEGSGGTEIAEKHDTGRRDGLTERIIGLGIKVHRRLGPGLLESVYAECLRWELRNSGMSYTREAPLAVTYEDMRLDPAYRADIIVDGRVILEIKSDPKSTPRPIRNKRRRKNADAATAPRRWCT